MTSAGILAHGLGGRSDLPLPTWMVLYGGGFTVVISFSALVLLWTRPRWEGTQPGRVIPALRPQGTRVAGTIARSLGVGALLLVVIAAAVGDPEPQTNLAPTVVYITFWVGMALLCGLVYSVWRSINPYDTLVALGEAARSEDPGEQRLSPDVGYWPAVAGIFGFVWLELVYPDRAEPRFLAVVIIAYSVVVVAAGLRWGRGWLRKAEAFTALFDILGHGAVLGRDSDNRLRLRPPFAGLVTLQPDRGLTTLVLVVLGSTTFDGVTRTQFWIDLSGRYTGIVYDLVGTLGLLWAIALVSVIYTAAIRTMARMVGRAGNARELALAFAHSLVPIALAYSVAHYFSLFVLEGQAVVSLISDPLNLGWDLFGTADWVINYTLLSPVTISYVQAGAIVAGHIAGVVLAHDRALAIFGKREGSRSQYPLVAAMVTFTVGGLFLLFGG